MDSRSNASPPRSQVVLAFACVYTIWGATYTATRYGVHLLPAPVLAGARMAVAGPILLLVSAVSGHRLWGKAAEMRRIVLLGVLMLFFGNVGMVWAEGYLPSGLTALLLAIIPVYVVLIEWMLPQGERLRPRGLAGGVLGFFGLAILAWPSAGTGLRGDMPQLLAIGVLLLGGLSFAGGSVLSRHSDLSLHPLVCAGWEMVVACLCNLALATALGQWGEGRWNRGSVSAMLFLALFGSIVGFTCYTWLLQNVPVSKVATYAYVNPIVAVLLGSLFLAERPHGSEWIGMAIILLAVFLVTSSKLRSDPQLSRGEPIPAHAESS